MLLTEDCFQFKTNVKKDEHVIEIYGSSINSTFPFFGSSLVLLFCPYTLCLLKFLNLISSHLHYSIKRITFKLCFYSVLKK